MTASDVINGRWQYCRGEYDISSNPFAELDATEIRVWDEDLVVVAMVGSQEDGWRIIASDVGHLLSLGAYERRFTTPQDVVDYMASLMNMTIRVGDGGPGG